MKADTVALYVIATPIGNLEDITLRALRILKEVDIVACEDTRITKHLLTHFDIHTPVVSFHAHSGLRGIEKIIGLLSAGKSIALVSDAGTPGISDPGLELVSVVRERLGDKILIQTVPGPSALTAALAISGLRAHPFMFYGFLPPKKGREKLFAHMVNDDQASIFYESPHRILKTLDSISKYIGVSGKTRRIGVFRELTKIYEEASIGSIDDVRQRFISEPEKIRGEFTVIIEAQK